MKKLIVLVCLLAFAMVSFGQATEKKYTEIYSLNKPLSIKVVAGTLVYRADSNFYMVVDSTFKASDSGITMVRRGGTYFHLQNPFGVKYSLAADTASTTLRIGSMRITTKYLWIKSTGGTWKKIALTP